MRCVERDLEDASGRQLAEAARERRLRARRDPKTGKLYLPGTLEDYGL